MKKQFYFTDNWVGDVYKFDTLRQAKKEAKNHTCGHTIAIYCDGQIVSLVKPRENPLP